jgi:hypothetical protein
MIVRILKVSDTEMPYDTIADWRWLENNLFIHYVDLGNPIYEWLLWHHEMDEATLCKHKGIDAAQVDEFDKDFERKRKYGDTSEPGDETKAPYHFAHTGAELNERALAATLGIVWGDYGLAIDRAFERVRKARSEKLDG